MKTQLVLALLILLASFAYAQDVEEDFV